MAIRHGTTRRLLAAIAATATLFLATDAPVARAQDAAPEPPLAEARADASAETPSAAELLERIEALRELAAQDPNAVDAVDALDDARAALDQARTAEAERAEFERLAREAPATLESIREQLASPPPEPELGLPETPSVSQVEQALAEARAELDAARQNVRALEAEQEQRQARLKEIPARIAELREQRRSLLEDMPAAAPESEAPLAERARHLRTQGELRSLEARIARHETEQQSYIAGESLLPAREARAERRAQLIEKRIDGLMTALASARERQAQEAAQRAERLKESAQRYAESSPTLRAIAEENVERTAELSGERGIAEKLSRADRQIDRANAGIDELRRRFHDVRERVEEIGLTDAVGVILRRELDTLPDARRVRADSLAQPGAVSDAQLRVVKLEDRMDALGETDTATLVGAILAELPGDQPEPVTRRVEEIARQLIEQRQRNLAQLKDAYEQYVTRLATLQGAERTLINVTDAYRGYIEERILWVRSIIRGRLAIRPAEVGEALRWLFLSPPWLEAPGRIARNLARHPMPYLGLAVIPVAAFVLKRRARRGLRHSGQLVASFRTDRFSATLRALGCTLLLALPWPLVVFAVGTVLRLPPDQTTVAVAAGAGLQRTAMGFLLVEILRLLLKPGGVGDLHFRWRKPGSKLIRRNLAWFVPLVLPLLAIRTALDEQPEAAHFESLGRLTFVVAMIALAVFSGRVLSPRGPFVKPMLREGSWPERLRLLWYPLLPGIALALAVLPLLGYFESAVRLLDALRESFWFILLVVIVYALLNRWLFIARRRLAVEHARKAREAAAAARKPDADTPSIDVPVEETVDIPAIDQQTRRLFRIGVTVLIAFGLYALWSDVLPALKMLKRVQVWPTVQIVDLPLTSIDPILLERSDAPRATPQATPPPPEPTPADAPANGATAAQSSPAATPTLPGLPPTSAPAADAGAAAAQPRITLADVGLAIVIAVITFLAARNLPGLLEIAFLTKLPLDSGSRFAISTIARYAILIVGITVAFGAVHIGWSQIQWLAAALTFGLAFGLQEIFANFVSGLIILAERPVRVGDTVTVGNVSGTVSRIQMRATTITDWDRKELIVPNKSFITDQVINWSLSSTILRVILEVGVAYGADVEKAERLLYEAADECDFLLNEPPPRVFFLGFGDNSLSFRLQGFIGSIDYMLSSKSALHFLVNRKFNEAGVVIAFPQRDVHLDSAAPIRISIVDEQGRPVPGGPAQPGAEPAAPPPTG